MALLDIFKRKAPRRNIAWQDGRQRSIEPAPQQYKAPKPLSKKRYGWKTNFVSGVMNAAALSGVLFIADVQASELAPLTSSSPTQRQP